MTEILTPKEFRELKKRAPYGLLDQLRDVTPVEVDMLFATIDALAETLRATRAYHNNNSGENAARYKTANAIVKDWLKSN